jgi:hypothetical protein
MLTTAVATAAPTTPAPSAATTALPLLGDADGLAHAVTAMTTVPPLPGAADCSALPYQNTELLCICAIPWISR